MHFFNIYLPKKIVKSYPMESEYVNKPFFIKKNNVISSLLLQKQGILLKRILGKNSQTREIRLPRPLFSSFDRTPSKNQRPVRHSEAYEWVEMYALEDVSECGEFPSIKMKCALECFDRVFGNDQVLSVKIRGKPTDIVRTMVSFLFSNSDMTYSETSAIQKYSSRYLTKLSESIPKDSKLLFVDNVLIPFFISGSSYKEDVCYMVVQKTWFYMFTCDMQKHYNRTFPIYPILARQHFFSFSSTCIDKFRIWHVMYLILKWTDIHHRNRIIWMLDPLTCDDGWNMYQDIFTCLIAPYGQKTPEKVLGDIHQYKHKGKTTIDPFSALGFIHSVILMDARHAIKYETLLLLKKWLESNTIYKDIFKKTLESVDELLDNEHALSFLLERPDGTRIKMVEITDPIYGKHISSKENCLQFKELYKKMCKIRTDPKRHVQILVDMHHFDDSTKRNWNLLDSMLKEVWEDYIPPKWEKFSNLVEKWQKENKEKVLSYNRKLFLHLLLPLRHWAMGIEDGKNATKLCESFCIIDVDLVIPISKTKRTSTRMNSTINMAKKDETLLYKNATIVRDGILTSFIDSFGEGSYMLRMNNETIKWLKALERYSDSRTDEYWNNLSFWGEQNPFGEFVSFCINFDDKKKQGEIYDDAAFPLLKSPEMDMETKTNMFLFFDEGLFMDMTEQISKCSFSKEVFGEKKKRKLLDGKIIPSKRQKT